MTEWSGKQQTTLPAELIDRFRIASLERLERLEARWVKLVADPTNAETIAAIDREVHTLKGESRMVGFTDVDMVAHKLEDVLEVARERSFQISDDIDLVVTMALRFMTMLIRKRAGQTLGGIDLPGFVRQIDSVVAETRRHHPLRGRVATSPMAKLDPNRELLSGVVRNRLASVAVDLLLEIASGRDSRRVQRGWKLLRDSLAPPDPIPISPALVKHEQGALELACDLDKEIALRFDLSDEARMAPSIVEALDVATLHLLRNAIDHGVESPDERDFAQKPREAQITVRCWVEHERVVLEVIDDGHGIDYVNVRSRAIALGLLEVAHQATEAELARLLFHPGLSTRKIATEVSGRGIGLDVVASQVNAVGGNVSVRSHAGDGATWTVSIPSPVRRFRVRRFSVRGMTIPFAVSDEWTIAVVPHGDNVIDLVEELAIGPATPNPLTLELTRGDTVVCVAASGEPADVDARWLVSTAADATVGVVSVDGDECLLLRPELLAKISGRVAVVDDSEIVRELVGFSLKPHDIEVVPFSDPRPLVGTLAVTPVDLVLLDISFKGLDVPGLIARIRSSLPGCLVYLYSDRTPSELAQLAEQVHADGHISKTIGRDQFVSRVLRILRVRRAAG